MPGVVSITPEHEAALSLYREGRNSTSPFYRFLCFYKILEAWRKRAGVFASADRLIREKGLPFRRARPRVTQDMLNLALLFRGRPELLNRTFTQLYDGLAGDRAKVAHAVTESGEFVNLDDYSSQTHLGALANLLDQVARILLLDEFDLWRKIVAAGAAPLPPAPSPQDSDSG
jgi:hypothetical protein